MRNTILKVIFIILIFAFSLAGQTAKSTKTITFPSSDGLILTADLYKPNPENAPFIILFHQAQWSRGEYVETAPKLNGLGFNCLAVDQRSGGQVNEVINQAKLLADEKGLPTEYMDALPDLMATIKYVEKNYKPETLIIWGSSYSSSFVLKLAGDLGERIEGVLAFSPAEYSQYFGTDENFIRNSARKIKCPVFMTAARNEADLFMEIYEVIPGDRKHYFIPATDGNHGSRALWEQFDDSPAYWKAVNSFLEKYYMKDED